MTSESRRQFLQFIAASPLVAALASSRAGLAGDWSDSMIDELAGLVTSPADALNVFDLHRVAKANLPPAHYGYMATGTDGNDTLRANREAFQHVFLKAQRLIDVSTIDTKLELLGEQLNSPIMLAPTGSQRAFHPEGELAVARAARSRGHTQVLSNVATTSIEDVNEALGAPVWFQLYPTAKWSVAEKMLHRAEKAGAPVVMLTVDLNAESNRELMERYAAVDARDCSECHSDAKYFWLERKPMYYDTGFTDNDQFGTPAMTWEYVERLKDTTSMKVVVKGIVHSDDALRCIEHGADGVVVSNHGGRAEASGQGTLDSLPGVVAAIDGRIPVIVDSGFRRGTDVFKALAMGADAVMIGRAYLWGLAAFGQPGVEKVLDLLDAELNMVMGQMGTPSLVDVGANSIGRHRY
jgi:isopentenyl diphosphate isomerase/L-lactate dehydrogenase-like FMN-dependent dehydrogenase